jgi:tRNA A58 N-methylase Trm61
MQNKLGIIAAVLAVVLLSSTTLALAQAAKASGTVVVVEKEVVKLKGADGKTYEVKMVDVIEKNLKTGDVVEYEVIEGRPVKVAKKK